MRDKEPVAFSAAVQSLVAATLFFLSAFDIWRATEEQQTAIYGLFAALIGVSAFFVRRKVTPTGKI